MNFLAHAYLSFGDPGLITGNLISDFVKGKKKFDYPLAIQNGITLHRDIDTFTDASAATAKGKEIFRPAYRLYSGAFVDVVYDHFLALDTNQFSEQSLYGFSQNVYAILEENSAWLPERFAKLFPYMKSQNWLYNYRAKKMIHNSFNGLVRRSAYMTEGDTAFSLFESNYEKLKACYDEFIVTIKPFAKQRMLQLAAS